MRYYKYIIGIDPGVGSLGISVRNTKNDDLFEQTEYTSVDIIRSGVTKTSEGKYVSFAADCRKYRSVRTLYQHRKRRKQETLKLLINENVVLDDNIKYVLCPLSKEELDKWIRYDKKKGYKREYPTGSVEFGQWMKLDFNGDGKVDDYSSPYQLRKELVERQFDFSTQEDCYKLGRALYHIAQRRGFKSNKGGMSDDSDEMSADDSQMDDFDAMERSEKKQSKTLVKYMEQLREQGHKRVTAGYAMACLENEGVRLRDSEYQAVRAQLKEEIRTIFEFQHQLSVHSTLYQRLVSEKKHEGTIFYQCPIKSQKGNVEHCTLEPRKKRCQVSHPEFEKYRAWSFINNIRIRLSKDSEWQILPFEIRQKLYDKISGTVSKTIDFGSIRKWIEKELGFSGQEHLSAQNKTINFKDDYSLSGCPTIGRLRKILGDDWETWRIEIEQSRKRNKNKNKENKEPHAISYDAIDLWHICTTMENETALNEFMEKKMPFDEKQKTEMMRLYKNASSDYARFSVYALQRINRSFVRGFNNYEAILLAKIPDIIGDEQWAKHEKAMLDIIAKNRENKRYRAIANHLIADYKSQDDDHRTHDYEYKLEDTDWRDVENTIKDVIGTATWKTMSDEERNDIKSHVGALYQQFFQSPKRDYYKMPVDAEAIEDYLREAFSLERPQKVQWIYTPSSNEYYPSNRQTEGRPQFCSPARSALNNPSALRILYLLRRRMNGILDRFRDMTATNTHIVVELPRELNDANMRRAIDLYQKRRENENNIFKELISENTKTNEEDAVRKVRLLIEQSPDYLRADLEANNQEDNDYKRYQYNEKIKNSKTEYHSWLNNSCVDIYSGEIIPLSALFDDNQYDIEHTIPRSVVLEDCLENKTITSADFNRKVKGNLLPTQLPNYTDVVVPNLQPWKDRVELLEKRVMFWKKETKRAADPDRKNDCIVQRHLWQMELNYWSSKLERFLMTKVKTDFVNKQMSDTRVISKYIFHYLKSCFSSVDMQYGCTNAIFREIFEVQAKDEKKDRSNHTHHAVDAMVLTFIPSSAQRCRMMKRFFQIQEVEKQIKDIEKAEKNEKDEKLLQQLKEDLQQLKAALEAEKNRCLHGNRFLAELAQNIRETTLVNHANKDQALTPAKRRGILKRNGEKIPCVKTGDCIRGQLHNETFYGAITLWERDENGRIVRDADGHPVTSTTTVYVERVELKYKKGNTGKGFTSWEDLEKKIIDKSLYTKLKEQHPNETFQDACKKGFFTKRKINGKYVENRIRHVRCKIPTNQGIISIKPHVSPSSKEHKRSYYAAPADLPYACEYRGVKEQKYVILRLFDIAQNRKNGEKDIPTSIKGKKEKILHLVRIIRKDDMVLLYKDTPEELDNLDRKQLAKRLYRIRGLEKAGRIKLIKHDISKDESEGRSCDDFEEMISRNQIKIAITKLRFVLFKEYKGKTL